MKLVIATRNRHKLAEIKEILELPHLHFLSALNFPHVPDVVEDGKTFEANAIKKALTYAKATGFWSMADDSGLEVDALEGEPGVMSARYAGEPANYEANNKKLLENMAGIADRRARFRCVIALCSPAGMVRTVDGRCEGTITADARGTAGFGYDPIFIPDGYIETFAEMDPDEKNKISHRARALEAAREKWGKILTGEQTRFAV